MSLDQQSSSIFLEQERNHDALALVKGAYKHCADGAAACANLADRIWNDPQLWQIKFGPIDQKGQIGNVPAGKQVAVVNEIKDKTDQTKDTLADKTKKAEELQKELKFAFENSDGYVARQYKFNSKDKTQKEAQARSYEQLKLTVEDLCKGDKKSEVIRYLIVKLVSDKLAVRNTAHNLLLYLRRNGVGVETFFDQTEKLLESNDNKSGLYSREDFSELKDGKHELQKRIHDITNAPDHIRESYDTTNDNIPSDPDVGD